MFNIYNRVLNSSKRSAGTGIESGGVLGVKFTLTNLKICFFFKDETKDV